MDSCLRVRDGVVWRLLHLGGEDVVVGAHQPSRDRVVLGARAPRRELAEHGIERMRFALGVDDDLRGFHERFAWHPLLGRLLRRDPALRVLRRPEPFEALAWAVCEQLIEFERAAAIERRIVRRFGHRCERTGLRAPPDARTLAGAAPARLASFDLAGARAQTLVRVAREVAAGRVDLEAADPAPGWRRLRALPGVGAWTTEMLALHGQGRHDQLPAADVSYLKLVGRLLTGSPHARAGEDEVRAFFAPFAPWAGLAGEYLRGLRLPAGVRVAA